MQSSCLQEKSESLASLLSWWCLQCASCSRMIELLLQDSDTIILLLNITWLSAAGRAERTQLSLLTCIETFLHETRSPLPATTNSKYLFIYRLHSDLHKSFRASSEQSVREQIFLFILWNKHWIWNKYILKNLSLSGYLCIWNNK